mmetsp:Transcript_18888/g.38151  ORF Transcript_18888/g.38151 Transcript_18888/m.38151 type:complete len:80 (+) Transcript_18888:1267-1506(+)
MRRNQIHKERNARTISTLETPPLLHILDLCVHESYCVAADGQREKKYKNGRHPVESLVDPSFLHYSTNERGERVSEEEI